MSDKTNKEKELNAKVKVEFIPAANKVNIVSGENISTSFGKIAKYLDDLDDLGTAAYTDSDSYATSSQGTKADNAVSTVANQGLTNTQKTNARTNIGAGTSNFDGDYNSLSNPPTIPPAVAVKGNAETAYRIGNVNLTAANIGAATSAQGTKADSAVQTIKMNGNAVTKTSGVVDLGTVITAHQDISGKADKSATVSNVTYDTTNKKLTKTINGTTTDVVTTAKLKTDMALSKSDVGLGNVGNFKAVSTAASQGLTDTEKANARTNIGAGTSSFSGSYKDLDDKPNIPNVINNLTSDSTTDALSAKQGKVLKGLVDGNAEITETSDTTPYPYKASEHDALYDELVGGSVAWNQLIPTTGTSGESSGVTFTNNGDGSWTLNGTSSGTIIARNLNYTANKKNYINNHKYFMYADCDDSNVGIAIVRDVGSAHYAYGKTAKIINYVEGSETASWARIQLSISGYTVTNVITKPQVFDLTQMFGSTIADYAYNLEQSTAGSGIVWLKSYGFFTKDYYAYNAGGLISANTSGKKVVGKNLLRKLFSTQTKSNITLTANSDGTLSFDGTASSLEYFSINFNLAAGAYIFTTGIDESFSTYDTYLSLAGTTLARGGNGASNNFTLERESELQITFRIRQGISLNGLILYPMIRRADVTDATFEPYTSITYPIQSTDLRGLYKLNGNNLYTDGDIYSADGTVTRKYGIVDLGTLEWTYYSGNQLFYADSPTDSIEIISGGHPCICSKYPYVIETISLPDKTLLFNSASISGQKRIHIRDSSYTDAATFKTAMSGVYLIYELATPTTETAQPFASPQIVYRNGTEEYLDTRDVPIPVGGNRKYVDIPDWMVNEYFDDLRISADELTQDLDGKAPLTSNNSIDFVSSGVTWNDSSSNTYDRISTYASGNKTAWLVSCPTYDNGIGLAANGSKAWIEAWVDYPKNTANGLIEFYDTYIDIRHDSDTDPILRLSKSPSTVDSKWNHGNKSITMSDSTISIGNGTTGDTQVNIIGTADDGLAYNSTLSVTGDGIQFHNTRYDTNLFVMDASNGNCLIQAASAASLSAGGHTLSLMNTGIIFDSITIPYANNAGFHNSIFRGKYLGSSYTAAQKAKVQAGTFDDLFVGDYWTINNINWRIAHFDYYLNTGDTATTKHHLVIVPDETLTSIYMNTTDVTTGAYVGSYMYTTTLLQDGTEASDSVFGKIKAAFGESNLLSIRQLFANAVDSNGNVSGWAWYNTRCFLMNQCMVYGHKAWVNGNNDGYNVGIDKTQLALFAHNPTSINTRQTYWLRDVRSSADFALVNGSGRANRNGASGVLGVRPVVLLSY